MKAITQEELMAYHKAVDNYDEAKKAYKKAKQAYEKAHKKACEKAHDEAVKTAEVLDAMKAYEKAKKAHKKALPGGGMSQALTEGINISTFYKAMNPLFEAKKAYDEVYKSKLLEFFEPPHKEEAELKKALEKGNEKADLVSELQKAYIKAYPNIFGPNRNRHESKKAYDESKEAYEKAKRA